VRMTNLILAVPIAAVVLAGCGSSSASKSASSAATTSAPATVTETTTAAASTAFLAPMKTVSTVTSAVPANGDVNPYGIVLLSTSTGKLHAGSLLISNFNDKANNQGTGTTVVEITPAGHQSVFSTIKTSALPGSCPGGVGPTTALSVLPGGYVVVGSLPTTTAAGRLRLRGGSSRRGTRRNIDTIALSGAIAALPDEFRDALVAIDEVGLSYREAARALRVKQTTIRALLHRARQRVAYTLRSGRVDRSPHRERPVPQACYTPIGVHAASS